VAYERLTLLSPNHGGPWVKELSISIPRGTRLLIKGPNDMAKVALFRATGGIWNTGEGRVIRPGLDQIFFLPERPYLPPGTLRELLLRTGEERVIPEERILATLHALDLNPVLERAGGLDVEQDFDGILSLGEQQLLAVARLLLAAPQFAFLDRISTALSPGQVDRSLKMLSKNSITYLAVGDSDEPLDNYDAVLELAGDGEWKLMRAGQVIDRQCPR